MVNRPPPNSAGGARNEGDDEFRPLPQDRGSARPRALQWSLRSLHKIDTSAQHFLDNYYNDDDEEVQKNESFNGPDTPPVLDDQTAFEIFKEGGDGTFERPSERLWRAHKAPLRIGVVDGKKVVFELMTGVTQRPTTSRKERLTVHYDVINRNKSPWDVRVRFWLMHYALLPLTGLYLLLFVLVNVIFAGFFYALDEHCCGDREMTFANVFAFTVQTSTTIGYGGYSPKGVVADLLVILLSFLSTLVNTLFAGLLFTKFVTPLVNIQVSDVMTMCNVNGVPCLTVRIGNGDGHLNRLTDVNVRLICAYRIPYRDHKGDNKYFRQSEELRLLSNRRHGILEGWELRHVLDETSPLFGLHFDEHPANKICAFTLSVDAVQSLTKSAVNVQTDYALEDIMIGHSFKDLQEPAEADSKHIVVDYSKMSQTEPYPVWYPSLTGVHETEMNPPPKSFGA